MIKLFHDFGQRIRSWRSSVHGSVGCKPTLTAGDFARTDRHGETCLNLESVNVGSNNLRVTNKQGLIINMRRLICLFSLLSVICLNIWSQSFSIQKTIPEANSTLESIQEITLIFDLDSYKADNPSIANWYIGCNVWGGDPVIALKDSKGDILAQIMDNADLSEGDSFTFSFENPVILSPNEQYTLVISEYSFALYSQPNFKGYTADNDEYEIQFYGSQSSSKVLTLTEVTPAANSVCANLDVVDLYFNEQIEIASGSKAYLYDVNSDEPIGESEIKLNEDEVSINLSFKDISLLYSHSYYVEIPANSIFLKGDLTNSYQKISINYSGSEYTYFGYGRISPANNRSLEYISTVTVPVNCSEDEYLGRDFKATANLYKVADEEQNLIRSSIECAVTENSKGFYINVYDFDLEPESTYKLVVDANQFYFWSYETQRPMRDTSNEELILTYTTPAEITPLPTQEFGAATPVEAGEKLESFILMFQPYTFEDTFYYPVFASTTLEEGYNLLQVVDENSGENVASFEVEIKWDNDNNYWLENVNPLDITLLEGHIYNVVVPAGMFCCRFEPLHDISLNKEYTVTYNGTTPTIDDFGLTANVSDRLHSHADVFSFVTESEIKAGEGATMKLMDGEESVAEAPVYVSRENNGYRAYADFGGQKLENGKTYDVVLPKGSVYAANGIVKNPEIKSAITAMPEQAAAPEFISVKLNIDEYATATYRMVKGEESVVDLKAGDDWKLESLSLNGDDVTSEVSEQGLYTLPALNEDATLDATYAYAHDITYDYTTGVGNIEDCPYSLLKDGSHLVISGLNGGEQIAIYTVGGMKIASLDTVPADMHEASLALPEGQIYIVMINNTSIKWKH